MRHAMNDELTLQVLKMFSELKRKIISLRDETREEFIKMREENEKRWEENGINWAETKRKHFELNTRLETIEQMGKNQLQQYNSKKYIKSYQKWKIIFNSEKF